MKYQKSKVLEITITLSEEEARYLMCLLQNYLGGDPDHEPEDEREYRSEIFHGLKDALK